MQLLEGSSTSPEIIKQVESAAQSYQNILVCLDSNHTHQHVYDELLAYSSLVTPGSYCIVYDTVIEDMPAESFEIRPWGPGNSPKTAVHQFLKDHPEFVIDEEIAAKLLITVAPDGWLRRI